MSTTVREGDAGTIDKILDRTGHQHLPRLGQGRDACSDVNGDATNVVTSPLTLAGVQTASDLNAARVGPSKVARNPSPVCLTTRPWERVISSRVISS
jgi:hypothetical protein